MAITDTQQFLDQWTEIPVSYNRRDLLIYAVGIGCDELPFVYEKDKKFGAFPTYPIVLSFKGDAQDVVNFPSKAMVSSMKSPPLKGVKNGLDGERYIEMVNPLPKMGAELILKTRLIGVHKRGSGASVESEQLLTDKAGKVYYRFFNGSFLVGATDFKDSGITKSQKIAPPARAPDAVMEMPTTETQAQVYRLSGDYNPLHVDPKFASMVGFKKPIIHGLCSLGICTRAILRQYGGSKADSFKALKLRFASPVLPGQTLVVEMWKDGNRVTFVAKVKETGKVCINNAYLELATGAKL
eukprot:TRINITY_DN65498_c0_g1_i1.p1 TRINITY_DN65498_c0_g1~~TRINITY_DN65498_c0_g1_i1.p1  ORF type:complete len:297 (+),score=127.15 TRINITY_DN65498_c0_g1_i1:79-969(+)